MGGICSCADREDNVPKAKLTVLKEKNVEFHDSYGLGFNGKTLADLSNHLMQFKPSQMRLYDSTPVKHTPLSINMFDKSGNKFDEILVKFRYNQNETLKIMVSAIDENSSLIEKGTEENLYIFGELEKATMSFGQFLQVIDKNNGDFKTMLAKENDMGMFIFTFFKGKEEEL